MRIDHHAYQQAVRVAGAGLLGQVLVGLTLLVFARVTGDTAIQYASLYVLLGTLAWLGLVVLFHQHKLERLEALEHDELAAVRGEEGAVAPDEERVAANRLQAMHRWLMPIVSLVLAAALGLLAWMLLRHLEAIDAGEAEFSLTPQFGWAISICLSFSVLGFIFSRFVAGMAKQEAWQNLRGGAAWMVGNALVALAVGVGLGFRFFKNDEVIRAVALAIPIFMIALAAEIVLNFVLNLYRPRIPGETPRPAFDSRLLSLLAAPDNIVRSINEAVNYQFGFDITSSWGYQLLLRSFLWLVGVGVAVIVGLNCIVIVEPHEQAVRLSRGSVVGDRAYGSGIMLKWPWPLETVETYPVTSTRTLHLTSRQVREKEANLWTNDPGQMYDKPLDPFMVGASRLAADAQLPRLTGGGSVDVGGDRAVVTTSLVDAEIRVQYRIRPEGGLLDWLRFSSDVVPRRAELSVRESALRAIALRQATQALSRQSIDAILAGSRGDVAAVLRDEIQRAFDERRTGVEVLAVDVPMLRPAGEAAQAFEELSVSNQRRRQAIAAARQQVQTGYADLVGDPANVDRLLGEIESWRRLQDELAGIEDPDERGRRQSEFEDLGQRIQRLMVDAGGEMGLRIIQAERDRWVKVMDARAQALRLEGQIRPYRAAPALYRARETMQVYADVLPFMRKFVLAIDPARIAVDMELKTLNPLFEISDALGKEKGLLE